MRSQDHMLYGLVAEVWGFLTEKEFLDRIKLTVMMLVFYRFLSYVQLPGVNIEVLNKEFFSKNVETGFLGFLNRFSGGAIKRMSIMWLGISPYITCSLFFSFAHHFSSYFAGLKKEGALGRQTINDITKVSAFFFAFFQGLGCSTYLHSMSNVDFVMFPGIFFHLQTALLLACSTMIVVWFADQISVRGVGSGSSMIIYASIVAEIPSFLKELFSLFKNGQVPLMKLSLFILMAVFLLVFVTFCERVYKTIKAQNLVHGRNAILSSIMPDHLVYMKLNPAGIYPSMFAGTLLSAPSNLDSFLHISRFEWGAWILACLTPGCYAYVAFHAFLIFITSYVYAELVFNPEETAKRFRNDTIISGKVPGKSTQAFLEEKLFYVATIGGIYLMLVCCLPELFVTKSNSWFYISGTSYIIVVGVATDLIDKVSAGVYSRFIEKSMKSIRKGYF